MDNYDKKIEEQIAFVDRVTVVLALVAGSYMAFYFIPSVIHKLFF